MTIDEERSKRRLLSLYRVKPHLQLKFSLVVFFFLASVALFVYIQGSLTIQTMFGGTPASDQLRQLKFLNDVVAKTFILGLAVSFGLSLFFSHFVAGPIYRFERVLRQMSEGRLDMTVQLRKNDELKHVAELFNQAIVNLRGLVRDERDAAAALAARAVPLVDILRKSGKTADADELARIISDVQNAPSKLQI